MQTNLSEMNADDRKTFTSSTNLQQNININDQLKENAQTVTEKKFSDSFLKDLKLPPDIKLSKVQVHSPKIKSSTLLSHNSYKIVFDWNGEEKNIERRYSNIDLFRNALMILFPFSYIATAHYKKKQTLENQEFIECRIKDLNNFFAFITANIHRFNVSSLKSGSL